jgi:nucleotide-binding universal stress UspA family protein
MDSQKTILIPWDFTPVAEYALQHAVKLNKVLHHEIMLVHIVKKDQEIEEASKKLADNIKEIEGKYGVRCLTSVKEGTIFTSISELSKEIESSFIIMGTHGMKGMQKLTGSWALKVISGAKVPSILVQDSPSEELYKIVSLPINFKKENKESVNWIYYLSRHFNSHFEILRAKNSDPVFKKGVESNIIFISKFCEAKNIPFHITVADGKKDFSKETIEFSAEKKADLILTMTTKDISLADYVLGAHEQFIIANDEKIPVMCVNPRPSKNIGGFRAAGG